MFHLQKGHNSNTVIKDLEGVKIVQWISSVEWQPVKTLDDCSSNWDFFWPRLTLLESRLSQTWPRRDWTNNSGILLRGREGGWVEMSFDFQVLSREKRCLDWTFFSLHMQFLWLCLGSAGQDDLPPRRAYILSLSLSLITSMLPGWSM